MASFYLKFFLTRVESLNKIQIKVLIVLTVAHSSNDSPFSEMLTPRVGIFIVSDLAK